LHRRSQRTESKERGGGYYIGWLNSFKNCPECGYEVQPQTIEAPSAAELGLDDLALAIEDKTNFDR